jgi:thiol:disulfide interchange protein DsbD
MLVFSATFALPFVLFAMFPNWLASLPKSGAWMNTVKVTLGFVELAAAFKFLSNADLVWGWGVLSRTLVISAWIVIFALAGLYLLGKLRLEHDETIEAVGTVRVLFAIFFLAFSLYLFPGLLGAPLNSIDAYLPPRLATDVSLTSMMSDGRFSAGHDGLDWRGNDTQSYESAIDDAFADSRSQTKPVLIDFTGYTCTNCRQMEANVFPDPEVADRLKSRFVLLRLFTDDAEDGMELQRYQLGLTGTVALPTYAVVDSDGQLLSRWLGMASVDEFTGFLDHAVAEFAWAD